MKKLTRRQFLRTAAVTAGGIAAGSNALALDLLIPINDPYGAYPYRGWETLYAAQWAYDTFGRSTHSANCTGSCTWKGYVRNGILFKEEQYADFPEINNPGDPAYNPALPPLPTYNPRGCQKGANYKEYVYGPQRVKYPLIRAGLRGEGKWRRATWDEALNYIASRVVAAIQTGGPTPNAPGPDTVTFFAAIPAKHFISFAGGARLSNLIGGVLCSFYDWYCDLPPGEPLTWGVQTDSCEAADWFNSSYLILWGANLLETRIPDAHMFTEARANGTKVVAIFPEYNPTSIHADVFVPVKPGTDAALALGMAKVIVDAGLHDVAYIKKYTDMPFLVRSDTGKLLRESDMSAGGSDQKFYLWDPNATDAGGNPAPKAVPAPGSMGYPAGDPARTLDLGAVDPALEGTFSVTDRNGLPVTVTTVFARLRQRLAAYGLASVSAATGVDAVLIDAVARGFATTKPARIIEGAGTNHYYHNDLINRAQILLAALTGNVGIPGGGFDHYVGQEKIWPERGFVSLAFPTGRPKQRFQNTTLWTFTHANAVSDVDGLWPRPVSSYIRQSVDSGWMPLYPKGTLNTGRPPKVLFVWAANYLNQAKGMDTIVRNLWPKLDLVVDINFRMDTTALYADVVLPAAGFFEKWDLNSTDLHSYIHPFTPVVAPLFESRTDWQIWRGLAAALAATGYTFTDVAPDGTTVVRNFANLAAEFDVLKPPGDLSLIPSLAADKDACQYLLDNAQETRGMTVDGIASRPQRFLAASEAWTSDLKPGEAYYGFQRMFELAAPLPTLTGRQQFYIDHDWYLNEFGEELPVYKPPVDSDLYPLRWVTPHGRWSIHSTWRDAKYQLRLQRGRPVVYLSPREAALRGLADNDFVEVFNDHGSFVANLYLSARLPDGFVQMYHGWERYFFRDATAMRGGWQSPTTIRIKPTQLIGGYGHVNFKLNYWGPTGNQKDTRVDVRKYTGPWPARPRRKRP